MLSQALNPIRVPYPKSFRHLLLVAFGLVALPLIFGIINNAVSIDRLADQSQRAVYQAVRATQASRLQAELTVAMERVARQYAVLDDPELLGRYREIHERFRATTAEFAQLPLRDEHRAELQEIDAREMALFERIAHGPNRDAQPLVGEYAGLSQLTINLANRSGDLVSREVEALREMTAQAQRIVVWQILGLIPVALFLVGGFASLIGRPIAQIDLGIRRLGEARFDDPIKVSGPEDLEHLGRQLDWLRGRLKRLEEQKARFLRHVSHELKTPLTALREGSDLLADEIPGKLNDDQREVVLIVRENSIRLQRLIEDMLRAVRSQQDAPALEPTRLRALVQQVADEQRLPLLAKELHLEIEGPDVEIEGDREKLRVVLDNLLSNAIKYSPASGVIRVRLGEHDGAALLEVIDQGPGIDPQDADRVFEAFYQGRVQAQGPLKGTGLGLSIARENVAAHRGRIEVVPGPGGAHLRVRLPLRREE